MLVFYNIVKGVFYKLFAGIIALLMTMSNGINAGFNGESFANIYDYLIVGRGGISESTVDIRLVLRHALIAGAPNLILARNHPSGNPAPSRQDDDLTMRLQKSCQTMALRLLDHIILGDDTYYSYADEGRVSG